MHTILARTPLSGRLRSEAAIVADASQLRLCLAGARSAWEARIPPPPSRISKALGWTILVTLTFASWNQIAPFLKRLDQLRGAA